MHVPVLCVWQYCEQFSVTFLLLTTKPNIGNILRVDPLLEKQSAKYRRLASVHAHKTHFSADNTMQMLLKKCGSTISKRCHSLRCALLWSQVLVHDAYVLYHCNTMSWTWWDWSLILRTFLQCFDTVGWVIWPVKPVPDMTYNVFGGTLNLTQPQCTKFVRSSSACYFELFALQMVQAIQVFCSHLLEIQKVDYGHRCSFVS